MKVYKPQRYETVFPIELRAHIEMMETMLPANLIKIDSKCQLRYLGELNSSHFPLARNSARALEMLRVSRHAPECSTREHS